MRQTIILSLFVLGTSFACASKLWGYNEATLEAWLRLVAQRTQGIPYRWGGENPSTGMDCSAYVRWVYAHLGVRLPRTAHEQFRTVQPTNQYRTGNLLFFSENRQKITHVGIYIGRGYMLHASGKWRRVVVEPVRNYAAILVGIGMP